MIQSPLPIIILTGPTASGKTAHSIDLAKQSPVPVEIINADSMLVYRGMDIGTAKPTLEERAGVPHHLIDIRNPDEPFAAGDFIRAANAAISEIQTRGHRPLIVGGTGFYLKALLFGMWEGPKASIELRARLQEISNAELFEKLRVRDPSSANRIGPADRYRLIRATEIIELTGQTPTDLQKKMPNEPDPRFMLWILDRTVEQLELKIRERTRTMLTAGWLDEVKALMKQFPEARSLQSVGYAQVRDYLLGKVPEGRKLKPGLEGLEDEVVLATRQLVKSQLTWFKNQAQFARFFLTYPETLV